jgi:hypothetical protein
MDDLQEMAAIPLVKHALTRDYKNSKGIEPLLIN